MQKGPIEADLKAVSSYFLAILKEFQTLNVWEKVEDAPVLISKLQREGRTVLRAQIFIELPFEVVAKYFNDPYLIKKISDRCTAFDILDQFDNLTVFHAQFEGFALVSNRQLVSVFTYHQENDNKAYAGQRSCDYACLSYNNSVRAFVHCGGYILEKVGQNKTRLINIIDMDPHGMIPGFVKDKMATMRAEVLTEIESKIKASLK